MSDLLRQLLQPDPARGLLELLLGFALYIALGILPVLGSLYLIYFLLTLPLRRNERARLLLDLLELGLRSGRPAEAAITEVCASRDRSLGARFHLLGTYVESGLRLDQALDKVPRLLPPQISAMLKTGARLGDIGKVIPACRLSLHGGVSHVRGALNYLLVLCFVATPFTLIVPLVLKLKILPAFQAVFSGMMEGASLPAFTRFIFAIGSGFVALQTAIMALVWLLTLAYLGGPRLRAWFSALIPGGTVLIDWLQFALPWRRKRLQRDFSAMLAALLEAGVPETEALHFAAESTANTAFAHRVAQARRLLAQGMKLPDTLRSLDRSGELQWRLANALQGKGRFVRALTGWHEALDAKAFQLEQTAAQLTTAAFVLLNGLIVAAIFIGMFLPLIQLLNHLTLW
jgi:type II secretory pathway component PulF